LLFTNYLLATRAEVRFARAKHKLLAEEAPTSITTPNKLFSIEFRQSLSRESNNNAANETYSSEPSASSFCP
jgi:hypothetical protein